MSEGVIGLLGIALLLVLLALRIPVALTMFIVGFIGISILSGPTSALNLLASESFTLASHAELIVIPLFILMGNVATTTGLSRQLYNAAYATIGAIKGGLASATVIGCAGFAALSGSSVAAALTMGKVSLSEMKRFNYSPKLSTGAVAAGGTLGILIPPSTGFVIYAILTEQSIGRLFLAGVLPGLLLLGLFLLAISALCAFRAEYGPRGPSTTLREKVRASVQATPILGIIVVTIGGIYGGVFSPMEASAVGAGIVIVYGFLTRTLSVQSLWGATKDSIVTTSTVMLILIGAHIFNPFLALSHIPEFVGHFLASMGLSAMGTLILILAIYLVLGCFLEGFAMLVLTLPIFFPVIMQLGIDPVWFGVLVVLTLEMGLISPPVGINVFIVKSVAREVPLGTIFIGVIPFWIMMIIAIAILLMFPSISLILPNTMIS